MEFNYLILYVCPRPWFLDEETNAGPWHPVPAVFRILCSNVRGLAGKLDHLTVASIHGLSNSYSPTSGWQNSYQSGVVSITARLVSTLEKNSAVYRRNAFGRKTLF